MDSTTENPDSNNFVSPYIRRTSNKELYECKVCRKQFQGTRLYNQHLNSKTCKLLTAIACSSSDTLTANIENHGNIGSHVICRVCNLHFNHERYLKRHNNRFHRDKLATPQIATPINSPPMSVNTDEENAFANNQLTEDVNDAQENLSLKKENIASENDDNNPSCNIISDEANTYYRVSNQTEDFPVYVLMSEPSDKNKSDKDEEHEGNTNQIDEMNSEISCKLCTKVFSNTSYLKRHANKYHPDTDFESLIQRKSDSDNTTESIIKRKSDSENTAIVKPAGNMKKYAIMGSHNESMSSSKQNSSTSSCDEIWSTCNLCKKRFGNVLQLKMHHRKGCPDSTKCNVTNINENNQEDHQGNSTNHHNTRQVGMKSKTTSQHDNNDDSESTTTGNSQNNKPTATENSQNNESTATENSEKKSKYDNSLTMVSLSTKLICDICKKVFPGQSYLFRHYNRYHPNDEYQLSTEKCDHCNKTFTSQQSLYRHIYEKHKKTKQVVGNKNGGNSDHFSCSKCNKYFPSKGYLLRHRNRYHRNDNDFDARYTCELCNKLFVSKVNYLKHFRTHKSIIEIDESGCQYETCAQENESTENPNLKFSTSKSTTHTERSTSENDNEISEHDPNLKTDKANDKNDSNSPVSNRQSLPTPNKNSNVTFQADKINCDRCNVSFTSSRYLLRHCNKYHRDEKVVESSYRCEQCHCCFGTSSSLRKHKVVHSRELRDAINQQSSSELPNENKGNENNEAAVKQTDVQTCKENDENLSDEESPDVEEITCDEKETSKSICDEISSQHGENEMQSSNKDNHAEVISESSNPTSESNSSKKSSSSRMCLATYQCDHCKDFFNNPYLLKCHHKRRHPDLLYNSTPKRQIQYISPSGEIDSEKIIFCRLCKKTFNHRQYLNRHNNKYHSKNTAVKPTFVRTSQENKSKEQHKTSGSYYDKKTFVRSDGSFVFTEEQKSDLNKMCEDLKQVSQNIVRINHQLTNVSAEKPALIRLDDMLQQVANIRHSIDNMENKVKIYNTACNENETISNDISFTISFEKNNQEASNLDVFELSEVGNTQEKNYACQYCDKTFNKIQYLTRHQNRFHADKISTPYKCDVCNVYFNKNKVLKKHLSRFHSNQSKDKITSISEATSEDNDAVENATVIQISSQGPSTRQPEVENVQTIPCDEINANPDQLFDVKSLNELSKVDVNDIDKNSEDNIVQLSIAQDDNTKEMTMAEIEEAVLGFVQAGSQQDNTASELLLEQSIDSESSTDMNSIGEDIKDTPIVILGHDQTFDVTNF